MSLTLIFGCAPTLGIATSLPAGLETPGAYCVPPAGWVQLVAVFQSVLVAPFQVIAVSTRVTVACGPPAGSGSSVSTLMAPALAVTVPCVCTCRASGGVFTVAEYLMVIDLPPAGKAAIALRVTVSPLVGAFGTEFCAWAVGVIIESIVCAKPAIALIAWWKELPFAARLLSAAVVVTVATTGVSLVAICSVTGTDIAAEGTTLS